MEKDRLGKRIVGSDVTGWEEDHKWDGWMDGVKRVLIERGISVEQ